ncbi:MAG: helix-turn-helix domain-containing protein [Phycisphaerales bacterium]|nr:helix-turn-helix domain-containing protein [Phycisphaerales bacterium]
MDNRNPPIPPQPSAENRHSPTVNAAAVPSTTIWLTVEQIRKMQRMRRERVIEAMEAGVLPYERRGRIRYARLSDVRAWEEHRLTRRPDAAPRSVHPGLIDLL